MSGKLLIDPERPFATDEAFNFPQVFAEHKGLEIRMHFPGWELNMRFHNNTLLTFIFDVL